MDVLLGRRPDRLEPKGFGHGLGHPAGPRAPGAKAVGGDQGSGPKAGAMRLFWTASHD